MKFRWLALIVAFLLLVYGASPYFSFWRFTAALRSGDSVALSSHRFSSYSSFAKETACCAVRPGRATHKWWNKLGPTLIDTIIDAYVTPDGIADI
jgi:hypothetical protein